MTPRHKRKGGFWRSAVDEVESDERDVGPRHPAQRIPARDHLAPAPFTCGRVDGHVSDSLVITVAAPPALV